VLWSLDTSSIKLDDIPDGAFDSAEEKQRVAALLEKYNHPPEEPGLFTDEADSKGATPSADQPDQKAEPANPKDESSPPDETDELTRLTRLTKVMRTTRAMRLIRATKTRLRIRR